jgi:hypothetical protein
MQCCGYVPFCKELQLIQKNPENFVKPIFFHGWLSKIFCNELIAGSGLLKYRFMIYPHNFQLSPNSSVQSRMRSRIRKQCCGSGSGILPLDSGWVKNHEPDPG